MHHRIFPDADLGVAEQSTLPAGEAHVAGQHELVTGAARAAANFGDAHDWYGRKAQHKVAPKIQHLWPFSCLGYVEMGDEEIGIRRLEHSNLHGRVRLEVPHQRSQFDDSRAPVGASRSTPRRTYSRASS